MDTCPHLIITGELYDQIKVGMLNAGPLKYLLNLEFDGRLVIETQLSQIARCKGLLCRPTSSGRVTEKMLESAPLPFVVGTLSVGDDHIDSGLRKNANITIIKAGLEAGGASNAKAVSEHAL